MGRTQPTSFGAKEWHLEPKGLRDDTGETIIEDALPPYRTDAEVGDFVPIRDQVVIELAAIKQMGSIHVPQSARVAKRFAKVVAVGPGVKAPLLVKVGDIVVLPKDIRRQSDRVVFGKKAREYVVIREKYIDGIATEG